MTIRHVTALLLLLIASANGQSIPELSAPIVIQRQRSISVKPSFDGTQPSKPGGYLRGADPFGTVLRFAPTVKGALISTEGYGSGKVGAFWNDGNTAGDKNLLANLCSSASDFTVDGQAQIRAYPWDYNEWHPKPDVHGPDVPWRADGLCVEGNGFRGNRLRFWQIPGTAIKLKSGGGKQAGPYGIYDAAFNELSDIAVNGAINGIVSQSTDAKLNKIYITGIVKDALTLDAPAVVELDHVWGADRSCVITQKSELRTVYHEAARIGTLITGKADGTIIDGLNIGPGTCWYRALKIEVNGCTVTNITGHVKAQSAEQPDIAGVEIAAGTVNQVIEGQLEMDGDGTMVILRGNRQTVIIRGGWNGKTNATCVRVPAPVTGCTVEITGNGDSGTVLDLSASGLDRIQGQGNEFKIKWDGTRNPAGQEMSPAKRVIYPGGDTKFNLAPGTEVEIDGVSERKAA